MRMSCLPRPTRIPRIEDLKLVRTEDMESALSPLLNISANSILCIKNVFTIARDQPP
jgi:hypothetical protein